MTILIFWTKFAQKWCYGSKAEKMSIIIEFCIFKLAKVPNFSWKQQFWFFGPNLPKKRYSWFKTEKWASPLISAYLNSQWDKGAIEFGELEIQKKTRNSLFWKKILIIHARYQNLQLNSVNLKYEISTSPFIYEDELKRSKFYFNLTEHITAVFPI